MEERGVGRPYQSRKIERGEKLGRGRRAGTHWSGGRSGRCFRRPHNFGCEKMAKVAYSVSDSDHDLIGKACNFSESGSRALSRRRYRPSRSRLRYGQPGSGVMTMRQHGIGVAALSATVVLMGAGVAPAQAPRQGPCAQIVAACEQAGFERGAAKAGNGIQLDCVRPIMQGGVQPRRATKPLPQVGPELVAACQASNPNFGQAPSPASQGGAPSVPPGPPGAQ
jgi:hypothetical protein